MKGQTGKADRLRPNPDNNGLHSDFTVKQKQDPRIKRPHFHGNHAGFGRADT